MPASLQIESGACSEAGRKPVNQDAFGLTTQDSPPATGKGWVFAIADGISSSDVSDQASTLAIQQFIQDYALTPVEWSVKSGGLQVLRSINATLNAQTFRSPYRFDKNRGYVCTFSALIIKSRAIHVFHLGDTRIYRLRDQQLQCLTEDHRFWVDDQHSYLARALGMSPQPEIDYHSEAAEAGDVYLLMSDGVFEHLTSEEILQDIQTASDLNRLCQHWVKLAHARGSEDNLTALAVRLLQLPDHDMASLTQSMQALPFAPAIEEGKPFDGYHILRCLHHSHRSHVYLARDLQTGTQVALKVPSVDLSADAQALERFYLEEWVARRISHRHILRPYTSASPRKFLYSVMHYVPGQTLQQWLLDHPQPSLETVRQLVEQITSALEAFHRLEMVYRDLQPQNILVDTDGQITLIDFGAVSVAGLEEMSELESTVTLPGTLQYSAPEQFLGWPATPQSDIYALGVITYQCLTGKLPYGTEVAKVKHPQHLSRLYYREIRYTQPAFPAWVDAAIARAVHPQAEKRYAQASEFLFDLRKPNAAFLRHAHPPLLERHPLAFWRGLSLLLACMVILLLGLLAHQPKSCANVEQFARKQCNYARQ
ncbi:protein kinase [Methylophilus glucosoxydans]|jgi:serine/threonine protein phosphatase PrpC|uniref:Protein kinase n=1 Tax=Methylophilus glucosoxydans TaxID=752553 RepID=A0ABW3GKC8_9PROT|nr:bifunctional protein-serine/threonine kinase/phosphatase [Methylophilus sp. 13]MBF5038473.1 bifunctional protein-serine/threonine kinase/phosphatase [Methylophilus sp. 13]